MAAGPLGWGLASAVFVTAPAVGQAPRAATGAPLTLGQLLDSVLATHPLVEASRARVRAVRGARVTAGTFGNPVLSFDVENAPFPGGEPPSGMDRESMLTAMLPLEPLYQRGPRVRRAEAEVRATEADATGERQRVAGDAVRAYYRAALAQVSVATARDLAGWFDTLVVYNRARVREGVAAEADLLRSELERDRAQADATMQEADLARAQAELATFLVEPGPSPVQVAVALDSMPLPLRTSDTTTVSVRTAERTAGRFTGAASLTPSGGTSALVRIALAERPEVRAARERVSAAAAAVSSERSMRLRHIGARFGAKWSGGTTSMVAGLSVPVPLLDLNRGEITRAVAERQAATFDVAHRERLVRAEVAGAYEAARLLTERATALAGGPRSYLARADEARRIALGAYQEGAVPLLQVLDAAHAWGEARLAFYRTLYAQHESVIALVAAQGVDLFTAVPALASRQSDPILERPQ